MSYIRNRSCFFWLAVSLMMSSCQSLLNTTPAKSPAPGSVNRPSNQKVVGRSSQPTTKKAVGQPTRKVSAVKPTAVRPKPATKPQLVANRTDVPLKGPVKRVKKTN